MGYSTPMDVPYILSTERLGLRKWTAADEEPFARMNQDPAVMEFFPRPLTPGERCDDSQNCRFLCHEWVWALCSGASGHTRVRWVYRFRPAFL
jgi:RimJ/RimL family protein N-acetyltransferase